MQQLYRLVMFAGALWVGGFLLFVTSLPRASNFENLSVLEDIDNSTGIVALTGGGGTRIEAAFLLLEAQSAARMLISGVHPDTRKSELAANIADADDLFDCCVDIGQRALTTKGNAIETREWVQANGYNRVILVTTDYHIPRAKAEIRRQMPDVEIIAWPVASRTAPEQGWLKSRQAIKVLAKEYTKFIAVRALQILNID